MRVQPALIHRPAARIRRPSSSVPFSTDASRARQQRTADQTGLSPLSIVQRGCRQLELWVPINAIHGSWLRRVAVIRTVPTLVPAGAKIPAGSSSQAPPIPSIMGVAWPFAGVRWHRGQRSFTRGRIAADPGCPLRLHELAHTWDPVCHLLRRDLADPPGRGWPSLR